MSLQILVAHTGFRLEADPVSFSSLDSLRSWISKATAIPPQDQILLTTRGKHVKLQTLLTEKEIYVFDRDLFTPSQNPSSLVPPTPLPESFIPEDPPATLGNQTDLKSWQGLFKARRDWATDILERCRSMSRTAQKYFEEQTVIDKGLRIATGNRDTHIQGLQNKHREAREWFEDVAKEQESNLQSWEHDLSQLSAIPAKQEFIPFMMKGANTSPKPPKGTNSGATLRDFIDTEAVRQAASIIKLILDTVGKRIDNMGLNIEKIATDYNELLSAMDQSQSRSTIEDNEEPLRLYAEIEAVVKKVASDYEHVLGLPNNTKSAAQVSKMALLHTRNFLPAIREYSMEMSDLARRSVEQKNASVLNAVENLQTISSIESTLSKVSSDLSSLEIPPEGIEAFELLALLSRLPFVYGSLLIEAVRRQEWADKMKKDSSTLAEEMAGFQEEEERRRKKWVKTIGDFINVDALQGKMLSFEIHVQGEEYRWPSLTRQDLEDYLRVLRSLGGLETSIEPLSQVIKELDVPTKRQVKHAKNFKMGSVHEAAFGKGSLLLRGEDEMRVLREANGKLEDELKASKSRVRKLEDLLHRQSHISRLSIGSGFPPQSPISPEPMTPDPSINVQSVGPQNETSRRSSISSRRFSSNQTPEDKALTRRILALEQELAAEKELRSSLEKDVQARDEAQGDLQRQIEEANSTKKDLMENMEAQQREFADERRSLEEELNHYKDKMEQLEDEHDRLMGSRDNERTGTDEKMRSLIAELDQIRKEAADEIQKSQDQVYELEEVLRLRDRAETERYTTLAAAYSYLNPDGTAPEDHTELIEKLEHLTLRSMEHLQQLKDAVDKATAENVSLQSAFERQQAEYASEVENHEAEMSKIREDLDTEKAKAVALSSELEDERKHIEALREKFAEGETGSEALRQRVAEEEAKVGRLSEELAATKSHARHLNSQLSSLESKLSNLRSISDVESSRLKQRAQRVKDLTQRLFSQTDRLFRLLEGWGFAVAYQDGTMVVQRASKANASALLSDASASMARSVTSPLPLRRSLEESVDLSFLQWMDRDNEEEEAASYSQYLNAINRFDLDVFNEAIAKRLRDIEYTARKYKNEARSYRDKAHRAQSEAHEKIAFRSFKEGDLALFLPTRNQATRPWAAFNVGAPHYFLREQDSHRLQGREWLVARISKVEERVVDLSKAMSTAKAADGRSIAESEGGVSFEDDNPFELSDGLRWYLLDAAEEKPGAPLTPALGKTTVASAHVDAKGSIRMKKTSSGNDASKTLNKSLESRRSSANSRKGVPGAIKRGSSEALNTDVAEGAARPTTAGPSRLRSESQASSLRPAEGQKDADQVGEPATSNFPMKRVPDAALAGASASASAAASPSKSAARSLETSPSKRPQKAKSGLFDSLWQFDISIESGRSRK